MFSSLKAATLAVARAHHTCHRVGCENLPAEMTRAELFRFFNWDFNTGQPRRSRKDAP